MFEKLFKKPGTLVRHNDAPYVEERKRYLAHCTQQGYKRGTLPGIAQKLLWVAQAISTYPDLMISPEQIKAFAKQWMHRRHYSGQVIKTQRSYDNFIQISKQWLRFIGRLNEPIVEPPPFADLIEDFSTWQECERGLMSSTIQSRSMFVTDFLRWYGALKRPISTIEVSDIDSFLADRGRERWLRVTVARCATSLRAFFRYAGMRGWCRSSIAEAIQSPRIFSEEGLPLGPSWKDVKRLLASTETEQPFDIRDRAILMFFSVYSVRASEVSKLRLEDIDWENDHIRIRHAKRRQPQIFPLVPSVGNAILKYLKMVRPQSARSEVFLTLRAPVRPIAPVSFFSLTSKRMLKLGIRSPQQGPHSLRHAGATHLLSEGFSLNEIRDHLGHRSSLATMIYAKVDLPRLRKVAKFDLGGLL